MSRTLKIFFIVLGLSIFILPKQMIFAQSTVECCDQKSVKEDCCKAKTTSCHSENPKDNSPENHCGDDCNQCNSCTVHSVLNYLSPEFSMNLKHRIFIPELTFEYGNSYFSSEIQNIWQPPKLS